MKNQLKQKVMNALIQQIEKELFTATQAAKTAHEDATNEESKPENQYDTRALEASYVARGQAIRVAELKEMLYDYKNLPLKDFSDEDPITATALIEVEFNGQIQTLFYMPKGGGLNVVCEGKKIQVVTPSTPLGQALLQLKVGDVAQVELGSQVKEYEIVSIA
jgi:hypothetical protein